MRGWARVSARNGAAYVRRGRLVHRNVCVRLRRQRGRGDLPNDRVDVEAEGLGLGLAKDRLHLRPRRSACCPHCRRHREGRERRGRHERAGVSGHLGIAVCIPRAEPAGVDVGLPEPSGAIEGHGGGGASPGTCQLRRVLLGRWAPIVHPLLFPGGVGGSTVGHVVEGSWIGASEDEWHCSGGGAVSLDGMCLLGVRAALVQDLSTTALGPSNVFLERLDRRCGRELSGSARRTGGRSGSLPNDRRKIEVAANWVFRRS